MTLSAPLSNNKIIGARDTPSCSNIIMPSRKKKSKAKGRKPAAGKGADNAAAVEQQKQGTLDSEMQRLKIGKQQADEDDALLEEAIKLAAVEEQEMKAKDKENCTHGYNPSSTFQARFCEDFMKIYTESFHNASTREGGNSRMEQLHSATVAFRTAISTSTSYANVLRNRSNAECIHLCCLAQGTKLFLDGKSDDARLPALLALAIKNAISSVAVLPDYQKMLELLDGDDYTLVQFFRKRIPCSCLDEKYKEVKKSTTKMGVCYNPQCPLPGHMAIRSKMLQCTGCLSGHNVSYCSRECQEANWPYHKKKCGKTAQEVVAMAMMGG